MASMTATPPAAPAFAFGPPPTEEEAMAALETAPADAPPAGASGAAPMSAGEHSAGQRKRIERTSSESFRPLQRRRGAPFDAGEVLEAVSGLHEGGVVTDSQRKILRSCVLRGDSACVDLIAQATQSDEGRLELRKHLESIALAVAVTSSGTDWLGEPPLSGPELEQTESLLEAIALSNDEAGAEAEAEAVDNSDADGDDQVTRAVLQQLAAAEAAGSLFRQQPPRVPLFADNTERVVFLVSEFARLRHQSRKRQQCRPENFGLGERFNVLACEQGQPQGAFGFVLEAEDAASGRRVAVKGFKGTTPGGKPSARDERRRASFLREITFAVRHLRRLHEDGSGPDGARGERYIVPVRDVGVEVPLFEQAVGGQPTPFTLTYVAFDWAPNGELLSYLTEPLPPGVAHFFFRHLVFGLSHLHRLGLAHRDVKPENAVLDEALRLQLCDFGAAVALAEASPADLREGPCTVYQPPEVWRAADSEAASRCRQLWPGGPVDAQPEEVALAAASDVWSAGMCLFLMLGVQAVYARAAGFHDAMSLFTDSRSAWRFSLLTQGPRGTPQTRLWRYWAAFGLKLDPAAQALLDLAFNPDPRERVTSAELEAMVHGLEGWFAQPVASYAAVAQEMGARSRVGVVGVGDDPSVHPNYRSLQHPPPDEGDQVRAWVEAGLATLGGRLEVAPAADDGALLCVLREVPAFADDEVARFLVRRDAEGTVSVQRVTGSMMLFARVHRALRASSPGSADPVDALDDDLPPSQPPRLVSANSSEPIYERQAPLPPLPELKAPPAPPLLLLLLGCLVGVALGAWSVAL